MNKNGCTTTNAIGQEQYEKFYTRIGRKVITSYQYDYRHTNGKLFTCVCSTLEKCREARDEWLKSLKVGDNMTYKTSNDYEKLCRLMERGHNVACLYYGKYWHYNARYEFCSGLHFFLINENEGLYGITSQHPNIEKSRNDFIEKCRREKVEFIDRDSQQHEQLIDKTTEQEFALSAIINTINSRGHGGLLVSEIKRLAKQGLKSKQ